MGLRSWPAGLAAFFSRISVRLLTFNLLIVFLPVAAVLYLDTYERQLLQALEHALVQQGRVLASALSDAEKGLAEEAEQVLRLLGGRQEARIRVLDARGRLLADSSRLKPAGDAAAESGRSGGIPAGDAASGEEPDQGPDETPVEQSLLYRIASFPIRLYRRTLQPPQPPLPAGEFYASTDLLLGEEVRTALAGRYGAATRISSGGQRSVNLYSAIPVLNGPAVVGVVLVSQSTYRILRDLYELRLQIFRIFLLSLLAAAAISLLVSTTIAGPLRRLRRQALQIVDRHGRLTGSFDLPRQKDEIGDLARALKELTADLARQLSYSEGFAADVSHEFKNPLASIRTATELLRTETESRRREELLCLVEDQVARLENLLTGVREISRIDAHLAEEKRNEVDLRKLVEQVAAAYRLRGLEGRRLSVSLPESPLRVRLAPERMCQVLENLLDNALSFSPADVKIELRREGGEACLLVRDRGPGLHPEHTARIFDRFFSYSPPERRERSTGGSPAVHSGLGLSIVKAVAEGYGGSVKARGNGGGSGACFEVRLPLV
jgi:two-component system sensor histidine kinase ChvG